MASADSALALPKSIDLSHHLSNVAKSRHPSPLKDIIQYMARPGMISLAGGLPHPSLFPFTSLKATAYPSSTVLDTALPAIPQESVSLQLDVQTSPSSPYSLAGLLQYSAPTGHPALIAFVKELTARIHSPAYSDYTALMNNGSTDGWGKVCTLLMEPGDYVLVEEQIYPSAQAAFIPFGCKCVVVGVDGEGAKPELLEDVLSTWDEKKGRRPHVIYLVPVGQNPLGSTMGWQRRKDIYDICVKYDVIIVEDDPYSMLQFGPYSADASPTPADANVDVETFVRSIEKSFLTHDYQGRVIRLDTFSKTIAPGARLGWFICNSALAERLLRGTEVQTQHPSGFSQMVIGELLNQWGLDGYLEWCTNLKEQYRVRRDWLLSAMSTNFELVPADSSGVEGAEGVVAFRKGEASSRKAMLSFVVPKGGMFLWCNVHYDTCPLFQRHVSDGSESPEFEFEQDFWMSLVRGNVLVTPGWYYQPWMGEEYTSTKSRGGKPGIGHFRLAFSYEGKEAMNEGVSRLADVMNRIWS